MRCGARHQQVVAAAEVAREHERRAARLQRDRAGAEQVADRRERDPHRADARAAPGRQRHDARQRALGVGRVYSGSAGAWRELPRRLARRASSSCRCALSSSITSHRSRVAGEAKTLPRKPLLHQRRQEAAVVEVGVAEHHGVDRRRLDRKRRPVALAQRLVALEQPAVEQDARTAGVDQVARAGDRVGGTEEADLHADSRAWRAVDRIEAAPACAASRRRLRAINPLSAELLQARRRQQVHARRGVERGVQQRLRHRARLDRAHAGRHPAHHGRSSRVAQTSPGARGLAERFAVADEQRRLREQHRLVAELRPRRPASRP